MNPARAEVDQINVEVVCVLPSNSLAPVDDYPDHLACELSMPDIVPLSPYIRCNVGDMKLILMRARDIMQG